MKRKAFLNYHCRMTSPAQQARLPSGGAPGKPGKVNKIYHLLQIHFLPTLFTSLTLNFMLLVIVTVILVRGIDAFIHAAFIS